jgi:PAS domain S-box-containing protein
MRGGYGMKTKSRIKQPDKKGEKRAGAPPWSEAVFRELADSIIDGVYCINTDGIFAFVNRAIIERSGISPDKFYASHFLDIVHPDYRDLAARNFQKVMSGESGMPYELRYEGADRQDRIVEVNSKPIRSDGKIVGLLGVSRNVTERKQAEEAFRESEERFRLAAESTADLIWEWDIRTGDLAWFGPIDKSLGYEAGEFPRTIGAWESIIHPDDHHPVMAALDRHLKDRKPYNKEYRVLKKDGGVIYWADRGCAAWNQEDKPYKMVGAVTDITDRRHMEDVLRKSEEKYRALLENASDAILLADTQGNIVEANRKAEDLWGYAKEELLQLHYIQLHPMPEMERTIAAFKKIAEKNTGHLSNAFIQRKDGDIIPVDITGSVIEDAGKKIIQGSFRDISGHKQERDDLEKLVNERTAELSRNNEQLKLEIKERKRAEGVMKKKSRELKHHADKLREMNAALKVLLKQREDDKNDLEDKVTSNVKELLLPYIEEMKNRKIDPRGKVFLSILETNLQNIISPFTQKLSSKYVGLTPREVQVADLIRQGRSTKEIARFMGISTSAISLHRYHIREKLGLIEQKINLRTHLQSLS